MNEIFLGAATWLLLTAGAGFWRLARWPGGADSLLGILLFGTTGTAMVLVLGAALGLPRATDIALVLALLAVVLGAAFVLRSWPPEPKPKEDHEPR